MSRFVTFTAYDQNGLPLAGLVPTFTKYIGKAGGDRTQPAIASLGGGKYGFVATDSDVTNGVAWVVDAGATAVPRYIDGAVFDPANPFEVLLYIDVNGALFVGPGTPSFSVYASNGGVARVAPALVQLANNYLYVFSPSTDDVAVGVGWLVASPANAVPAYYDDTVETTEANDSAVNLFSVTPETLRNRYFSQSDRWSSVSNPSETTVTEIIAEAAGRLAGLLSQENIDATEITDATSAAYLWCRRVVRLMAAIEVADESSQTLLSKGWTDQLTEILADLDEAGYLALGPGVSAPTIQPDGPTHFIDTNALDTSNNDQSMSSVDLPFHKSDQL